MKPAAVVVVAFLAVLGLAGCSHPSPQVKVDGGAQVCITNPGGKPVSIGVGLENVGTTPIVIKHATMGGSVNLGPSRSWLVREKGSGILGVVGGYDLPDSLENWHNRIDLDKVHPTLAAGKRAWVIVGLTTVPGSTAGNVEDVVIKFTREGHAMTSTSKGAAVNVVETMETCPQAGM
jgi:hypothetical protein